MSVKENLIAAKALIDTPDKWGKGRGSFTYGTPELSCTACVHEAIRRVVWDRWDRADVPEVEALRKALPRGFYSAPDFNDDPNTTHSDIMALFHRAIEACE